MRAAHIRRLGVLCLAFVLAPIPSGGPAMASAAEAALCVDGLGVPTVLEGSLFQDVRVLGPDKAIAVGATRGSTSKRQDAWAWWDGRAWSMFVNAAARDDAVLQGVAGDRRVGIWTVGFAQDNQSSIGIARRWTGSGWVTDSPNGAAGSGEVLIGVDVDPEGGAWAVGMRVTPPSVRTGTVWRHTDGDRWVAQTRGRAGSSFTGVAAIAADDVWVVGSRSGTAGIKPIVTHWDGRDWTTAVLPDLGVEAVLRSVAGTADGEVWAVGWRQVDGIVRPLVLGYRDRTWTEIDPPDPGGAPGLLLDVAVDAAGRHWVGGSAYQASEGRYVGFTAQWDGVAWQRHPGAVDAPLWVSAVSGDPSTTAWLAGRIDGGAMLRRVCGPTASPAAGRSRARHVNRRVGRVRTPADTGWPWARERVSPSDQRRLAPLGSGSDLPGWTVRDIAEKVGLAMTTQTYGADVGDLNGDGRNDLFLSRHGGTPVLWLRDGSDYVGQDVDGFGTSDRHQCAIGAVAGGDLPDVICSVGADAGLGLKTTELWLDPGSLSTSDVGAERGIADPLGRGRKVALFDADGDGDLDLLLGNEGMRVDGHASPTRLMRNDGTGRFTWDPASGLGGDEGADCVQPVDIDLDGDLDLVICAVNGSVLGSRGIMIQRNDGDRFREATRALGVRPIGEVEAAAGQLGGGPHPDLVQLSTDLIRISLWRNGAFEPVYERGLEHGRGLALGDADGDGAMDIFVQLGSGAFNDPDIVLRNDGTGSRWTPVAVPSTSAGVAESVLAFDHDDDGRDDFLVLNGWLKPGPIQLITFKPAGPARR